ncbi:hypothetical protein [Streptomyces sp. NPDC001948]
MLGADIDGLRAIARACPDTLTGDRDTLTGFHYASRSQDPAGLLTGDLTLHPHGLAVAVLTGKTKHSVRTAKIPYSDDAGICSVRAWTTYRTRLVARHGQRWADPSAPAFVGIDRWGNITGGMGPDSVTRAIKRVSARAGVPVAISQLCPQDAGRRLLGAVGRPGRERAMGRRLEAAREIAARLPGARTRIDGTSAYVHMSLEPGEVRIGLEGGSVNIVLQDAPLIIADAVVFAVSRFLPDIQTPEDERGHRAEDFDV